MRDNETPRSLHLSTELPSHLSQSLRCALFQSRPRDDAAPHDGCERAEPTDRTLGYAEYGGGFMGLRATRVDDEMELDTRVHRTRVAPLRFGDAE